MVGFSKTLTASDLEKLVVPSQFLSEGHTAGQLLRVMDNQTQEWYSFVLSTRRKGYPKPVFTKEWCKYRDDKKLQDGQILYFWKNDDEEFYRIQVLPGSFNIILTESDVSQELAVPTEFLGDGEQQIMMMDSTTQKMYVFLLSARDGQPVFTEEWLNYSRDQQLQAGQILYFWKNNNEQFYRIKVLRRLFEAPLQ